MPIVIRKRVDLDFLGEAYAGAYLEFQSVPVADIEKIQNEIQKYEQDKTSSVLAALNLLKKYFLNGEFPDDEGKLAPVTADDLDGLDPEATIVCFKVFTGQEIDPKDKTPLTSTSPTADQPPSTS